MALRFRQRRPVCVAKTESGDRISAGFCFPSGSIPIGHLSSDSGQFLLISLQEIYLCPKQSW